MRGNVVWFVRVSIDIFKGYMIDVLGVICIYVFVIGLYLVEIELRRNKINNGFKVIVCI